MKVLINREEMLTWRSEFVDKDEAVQRIKDLLECSATKARKIANGTYDREISASEQKAIAGLLRRPRDVVFKPVGKRVNEAS